MAVDLDEADRAAEFPRLIVDAEGHDTAVLCSMLAHCKERLRNGLYELPNVIQFETMGHCNKKEGFGAEWGIITALEAEDYVLYCICTLQQLR